MSPTAELTRAEFITDLTADPSKYSVEIIVRAIIDDSFVPNSCHHCGGTGEVNGETTAPWDTLACPECSADSDDEIPY